MTTDDEKRFFITQGDANQLADPNPVPEEKILGVKIFQVEKLGQLLLSLRNVKNFIICLVVLGVLFIAPDVFHYFFGKGKKAKTS
jgi:hypothetical protein